MLAHLQSWNLAERRVEKRPIAFVQKTARDIIGRLFPPYGNGIFDSVKKMQERMWILYEQCGKYGANRIGVVRESADFSAAVDELAAFFVDAEQNELEMLLAGGLVNETQKVEFAFAFGGKTAPGIASRDEQNLAEILNGFCLERRGECVQTPSANEYALVDLVNEELAENRLRNVVAVGKLLGEGQALVRVEESLFPVGRKFFFKPLENRFAVDGLG